MKDMIRAKKECLMAKEHCCNGVQSEVAITRLYRPGTRYLKEAVKQETKQQEFN